MAGSSKDRRTPSANEKKAAGRGAANRDADWTNGLKKLYDSVVDEPLPDSFRDLLSKLDSED
jgi:hypothetical protein